MAWIRLSDNYNDHPKFKSLSDGAFRLWHQAIGFARTYKTDGLVPLVSLRDLKSYSPKRTRELLTPWKPDENPLWHQVEAFGIRIHDYLDWNPSKEEENERRGESKERMRTMREARHSPVGLQPVCANTTQTSTTRLQNVPGWDGSEERSRRTVEKPIAGPSIDDAALDLRAGNLLNRYAELFYEHRHGARYRNRMHLDFPKAQDLVRTWPDDARLEKLAVMVLITDDDWISGTDRGFGIFAAKASWADGKLAEWEAHQPKVTA